MHGRIAAMEDTVTKTSGKRDLEETTSSKGQQGTAENHPKKNANIKEFTAPMKQE